MTEPEAGSRPTPRIARGSGVGGSGVGGSGVGGSGAGGRSAALEAPHRRLAAGPRPLEKAVVLGYRGAAWLLAHLPPRPAWTVIGWFSQAGYLLWPKKRRWVDANFGHVLGLSPSDRAVRRLALRAYAHYGRYLVEIMRLPSLGPGAVGRLVDPEGLETLEDVFKASDGLILVVGHVGNNEACAAGIASRNWPISVVADDSSFPEMFDLLRRQRESWGVSVIPWRNLRGVYAVLRRKEILALLVDWGYRADGIPVRLFDAWTTLPAGPATLAAKTGATILPMTIGQAADGRMQATFDEPIRLSSAAPAELQRATQAMANALQRTIAAAPEQWYSFKPMWPDTAEESAELAGRGAAMLARGKPDGVSPVPTLQSAPASDGAPAGIEDEAATEGADVGSPVALETEAG